MLIVLFKQYPFAMQALDDHSNIVEHTNIVSRQLLILTVSPRLGKHPGSNSKGETEGRLMSIGIQLLTNKM